MADPKPGAPPADDGSLDALIAGAVTGIDALYAELSGAATAELELGDFIKPKNRELKGDIHVMRYIGRPSTKHGVAIKGEREDGEIAIMGGKGVTTKMPEAPDNKVYVFVYDGQKRTGGGMMDDWRIFQFADFGRVPQSIREAARAFV